MKSVSEHFLLYWVPESARQALRDGSIAYAASNQLNRVSARDTLWIVTSERGKLFRIGNIEVDTVVKREEAEQLLGNAHLWPADFYAIARKPQKTKKVDITDLAERIAFRSKRSKLVVSSGRVPAQQLQAMRKLTGDAAELLSRAA